MTTVTSSLDRAVTWGEVTDTWGGSTVLMGRTWGLFGSNLIQLGLTDGLSVSDTYTDQIGYLLGIHESLSVTDAAANMAAISLEELVTMVDAQPVHSVTRSIHEALNVADPIDFTADYHRLYQEAVGILSVNGNHTERSFDSSFGMGGGQVASHIQPNFIESLQVADIIGRIASFSISLKEGVGVNSAYGSAMTLPVAESLSIADAYLRNADTVVSDLILSAGDISEDTFLQFMRRASPVGFTEYAEFVEGEYEYQEALFRIVMESAAEDRALVDSLKIHIDVPDVNEAGKVTVPATSGGATVAFQRHFNAEPEVTVTLKGGTVLALPNVTSSDQNGFTVTLKDTSGNPVSGTVSWVAQGY